MSTPLTPNKLRSLSKSGQLAQEQENKELQRQNREQRRLADLQEAQDRINEADEKMSRATSRGQREVQVCVLRGGIHFEEGFYLKQSPEFLRTIGKTIYDHFVSRGFKVSFHYWMDGMRIGELEEDSGYEVIVSW